MLVLISPSKSLISSHWVTYCVLSYAPCSLSSAFSVHRPCFFVWSISRELYALPRWYLVGGWGYGRRYAGWIWAWHMLIKYLICIIYLKNCPEHFSGTVCPTLMISGMWVGLGLKVTHAGPLGPLGSKMLNNALWLPNLVRRTTDVSLRWWWPSWGQWSSEVKCGKLYAMATLWSKELLMQTKNDDDPMEVKCGKQFGLATIFVQKNLWCKPRIMMIFMEVKGHQMSNVVNNVLWLTYLIKRTADAN